jgi:hypothetical protein
MLNHHPGVVIVKQSREDALATVAQMRQEAYDLHRAVQLTNSSGVVHHPIL